MTQQYSDLTSDTLPELQPETTRTQRDINWIIKYLRGLEVAAAAGVGHAILANGIALPRQPNLDFIGDGLNGVDYPGTNTTRIEMDATVNAGADLRKIGAMLQRAGTNPLLFSGSGALLVEYSTIATALAAASSGDVVDVPPGTWAESFTVGAGITVRGAGMGATVISGAVLNYGTMIDLTVDYTAASDDDLIVVRGGNSALCIHVEMTGVQSGNGDIIPCVSIADDADTPFECYDCVMHVENTGTGSAWWPGEVVEGGLRVHQGSLVTEIP